MEKLNDKVFLKTKNDGLWENSPIIAVAIYMLIYLILFFGSMFLFTFNDIPGVILAIWLILLTVGLVGISVYLNETRNMSKSTGFVKREGILYLIKLGYDSEVNNNMVYTPSGSIAQAVTLEHNIKAAGQVQQAEKEVRDRRENPQAYIDILDYKLNISKQKNYLPKGCIEFIVLDEPKVEKQNKNFIWVSYKKGKERNIKKIRNAYDGLIEEINNGDSDKLDT